ncbi:MAG: transcription antitermination factor NusB [Actinomycetota bacterium]
MSARGRLRRAPSSVRRRALELLHAADVAGSDPCGASVGEEDAVRALVEGVTGARTELDAEIRAFAANWKLERMPVVDRNLLRIGIFELLHTDAPTGRVLDDAVSLAKLLSTEDSGRFVNGVLRAVARARRT